MFEARRVRRNERPFLPEKTFYLLSEDIPPRLFPRAASLRARFGQTDATRPSAVRNVLNRITLQLLSRFLDLDEDPLPHCLTMGPSEGGVPTSPPATTG